MSMDRRLEEFVTALRDALSEVHDGSTLRNMIEHTCALQLAKWEKEEQDLDQTFDITRQESL